jgi:hypothetical protein
MVLTVWLISIVIFNPAILGSVGGVDFSLMSYGIKSSGISDAVAQFYGTGESTGGVVTSTLSICTVVVLGLAALVPLITIFLFKNRTLQVRLLHIEFVFLVVGTILFFSMWPNFMEVIEPDYSLPAIPTSFQIPFSSLGLVVAIVFNWLAIRGVRRDEDMVRAADRIR